MEEQENGNRIQVSNIANNFTLSLNVDRLGGREGKTQGKSNFDLPVQSIPAKQSEKEVNVNKDLSAIRANARLEKVVVTPLRIYLQGTASEKGGPFDYLVLDDKGEESVEVFRTTFGDKKLYIVNPNAVYYDQAFTVEFK
ncbi:hypothetical protein [Bacillus paramycoides]|uniref:Uncharacterized protein n=1 Tax=Bacillus paramycoides TaxID=2026194 RepID=A0A1J9UA46_9BACI|nr:hypothetical protein [Bacillus paramycoides]MED0982391.1 hypothetical protein [Bacillus paramycoides]MED1567451.1 hypothetical protein [Bacillus paramycoides]OJD75600.1 hypothetical protein BAU28_03835 [Bacillus paramycoides]